MSQTVTPELREWIISQAQAGFAADVVLKSMLASGWQEDIAIAAMESTLQSHLAETQQAAELPAPMTVPKLAIDDSPLHLQLEDRRVTILSCINNAPSV